MAWPNKARAGGLVHEPGLATALSCQAGFSASDYEKLPDDAVVTCLWCITGTKAPWLRWFKWADET